jgi:hypothetical protein
MPTENDGQPPPQIIGHQAEEPVRPSESLTVTVTGTRSPRHEAITDARRSLAGDSNHAEHDALSTLEEKLTGWETAPATTGPGPDDIEREIGAMVLRMAIRHGLEATQRDRFVAALEYTSLGDLISDCVSGLESRDEG